MIHSVARRVTDYPCLMGLGKGCRLLGNSTPAAGLLWSRFAPSAKAVAHQVRRNQRPVSMSK